MSIEYAYDRNGNLIRDDNKCMTFTYDLLGHPLAIVGSDNQTDYVYSADGRKLRATHTQGDNRTLIGSNGQRDQYSHFYPYGGLMGDISTNDAHSYKYGGKELDRDFGIDLFDFHARQYDAKLPAFTSIDPHAEKYYGISPYAYCGGDPVNRTDPTGKDYTTEEVNGAIIITAKYYCPNENSYASAQQAVEFWNSKTGEYMADGKPVIFNLSAYFEEGIQATIALDGNPQNGNLYQVIPDEILDKNANGRTQDGHKIGVKESRKTTDSAKHEIGHGLGLIHSNKKRNLMYPASKYRKGNEINAKQIKKILNRSGRSPLIEGGVKAGKGTNLNEKKKRYKNVIKIEDEPDK